MLNIKIEKDEFTGLRKINTSFIGFSKFISYDGPSEIYLKFMTDKTGVSDAFDLMYLETENGQGSIIIRVCSSVAKFSGNTTWPHWDDLWPMIADGERISVLSNTVNSFETNYELKIYELPIDVFNKICNAKELKYSLRGREKKLEGVLSQNHINLFKAFEQYCFGSEDEGKKIIESLGGINTSGNSNADSGNSDNWTCYSCKANNLVPNDWDTFSCHSCGKDNSITRPKNLSDEQIKDYEIKIVDLLKLKKVDDAIKFYGSNFGYNEDNSKLKVKEIAEKNGLASIYKNYETKNAIIGFVIIGIIIIVLFRACS
jgi:hypothetical protein